MSGRVCARHPEAARYQGLCAACLLERALPADAPGMEGEGPLTDGAPRFTVQVPLGGTAFTSVFLVRRNGPGQPQLLRLKRWHSAAPPGFLHSFAQLVARFADWNHAGIVVPLCAGVDAAGHPSVLSEFRQGLPVRAMARPARADRDAIAAVLARLGAVTREAHARGLAHGSIVSGNVLVNLESASGCLVDFGLSALIGGAPDHPSAVLGDLAGLAALDAAVGL